MGFYIPEDGILHSHRRENLKSYIALTGWTLQWRRNVSPVKYEMGFYIPEDGILHSHRRETSNLTSEEHRCMKNAVLYFYNVSIRQKLKLRFSVNRSHGLETLTPSISFTV
jgi:hypothetical protein